MRRRSVFCIATLTVLAACSPSRGGPTPSSGPATSAVVSPSASSSSVSGPSASSTPPPMLVTCPSTAKRRFAAAAAASAPVTVDAHAGTGLTTCAFRSPAGSRCAAATLRINTAPQAYVDFHRYVTEAAQNATSPGQAGLAPMLVTAPELGPEVDWVPAHRQLDTGVPGRWLTVTAHCAAGDTASRALARRLAGTAVGH